MVCSMSRKGDCYDNAPMESWFKTLKVERVNLRRYATRAQARLDVFSYVETFYNPRRRHSSLGLPVTARIQTQLRGEAGGLIMVRVSHRRAHVHVRRKRRTRPAVENSTPSLLASTETG